MDLNLATLSISEVYAHPVPLRRSGIEQKLTTAPCVLKDATRDRIISNIRLSLAKEMRRLAIADPGASLIFEQVSGLLHAKSFDLKTVSRELAVHLHKAQPGSSSEGMLLVAKGMCNGCDALALAKVENELRVHHEEIEVEGGTTYDLSEISTMKIDKQKVFKAALFVAYEDGSGQPAFEIVASDHQASGTDGHELADFFLNGFLGCAHLVTPADKYTRALNSLWETVNKDIQDPIAKASLATALLAEMDSENPTLNLDDVSSNWIPEATRPAYEARLKKNGIEGVEIDKAGDVTVDGKYLAFTLSNGLRIIGPKDTLYDMLQASDTTEDGLQQVKVQGTVVEYKVRKRM